MKRKHSRNQRQSSDRERRKKYFVEGVVKRGTSETWIAFCRWTSRLVKVILLAALAGGAYYGATQGWRKFFWQNPDYALRDIHFITDGTLTREQALAVATLKPGANIFSYKTAAIRDALRALPQVEGAEVVRYLPNRIEISVQERRPAAWLAAATGEKNTQKEPTHLLDSRGIVFQPRNVLPEFRALPTISGVQTEDLEPGKPIRKAEVLAALELLRRTRELGSFMVTSADVSKGYCIVATDQKHAQLTFGLDDIAGQLDRLGAVRSEAALIGQEIQTINLIPIRNIPVTFMQPAPPENDDAPEPIPVARAVNTKSKNAGDAASSTKDKSRPAHKRAEPAKPKEAPKGEGTGLLKRFRTA
ncbi:MAG: FtsQ-type POTRA domain-containing protein [Chthoniobacteraceae bacterium]